MQDKANQPLPKGGIDAGGIIAEDESFYYCDEGCSARDGDHDWHLTAIVDGCEIYECQECGLIDC